MLRKFTLITLISLLHIPALANATPMEAYWPNYSCLSDPEIQPMRKTLSICNQTQVQVTAEFWVQDSEVIRSPLQQLTVKVTIPQPPTYFLEVKRLIGEMPTGEIPGFEISCLDSTSTLNPTMVITTEDLEPWITFLFERLAEHWPWIHDITPQQIQTLSRLLATLLERVIPNQRLHTETEVNIQTIVEEIILETMKPERVQ